MCEPSLARRQRQLADLKAKAAASAGIFRVRAAATKLIEAQLAAELQQMQQMSSAQIVSATAHMQPRMGPPVTYGGFWQHPGALGGNYCQPFLLSMEKLKDITCRNHVNSSHFRPWTDPDLSA